MDNDYANQLLPCVLKNYPKKFAVKGQTVEFLEVYAKDVSCVAPLRLETTLKLLCCLGCTQETGRDSDPRTGGVLHPQGGGIWRLLL